MDYNHTQVGYLIIFLIFLIASFSWFILSKTLYDYKSIMIIYAIIFIIASFSTLNVKVDDRFLKIKFGYGIFKKKYLLKDISSVKVVKNSWFYGWGIRYWAPRRMWIYNISGFNAVEIFLKNGRVKRIGTDEPEKLEYALLNSIK